MSVSLAFDGYGVEIAKGDGASSEVFTAFAEIQSVGLPSLNVDFIDVTHASSPDKYKEVIAGLIDPGESAFVMNMVQADYKALYDELGSATPVNYQITIPDDNYSTYPTMVFAAYVTSLEVDVAVEDKVSVNVTLKVSGTIDYTLGT